MNKIIAIILPLLIFSLLPFSLPACTSTNQFAPPPTTSSPSPVPSVAPGSRMARFILSTATLGSFNAGSVPSSGTTIPAQAAQPTFTGLGVQAVTVFNTDNSVQGTRVYNADGSVSTSANWPSWITSFDIGVSGSNNNSSQNGECARFASTSEQSSSIQNCTVGNLTNCGAPSGQFRVSEFDCISASGPTTTGIGGPFDGVYIRAVFNRSAGILSPQENILVVIDYLASAVHAGPTNPLACFLPSSGLFSTEACSDYVWRAYLKHNLTENASQSSISIQPYFMVIPPVFNTPGSTPATRQITLPIATDPNLTVFQLTRTGSTLTPASLTNPGGPNCATDSALCAGVVFYTITFYRI